MNKVSFLTIYREIEAFCCGNQEFAGRFAEVVRKEIMPESMELSPRSLLVINGLNRHRTILFLDYYHDYGNDYNRAFRSGNARLRHWEKRPGRNIPPLQESEIVSR